MATPVKAIPEGFHTITPHLIVNGAAEAIDFYKRAFGAEEIARMPGPDGKTVMHAQIKIGDSFLMLADEFPQYGAKGPKSYGGSPLSLHIYVVDADASFQRAVAAGATVKMPLSDMFWGDRYGKLTDPYGHEWSIATHKKDLTVDEIGKAAESEFKGKSC